MAIFFGEKARSPFVTVWSVENKGKYVKAQISTSEKNKDNTYTNSSWFASFVGSCATEAASLERKDKIKITSGKISASKSADGKSYTNITVFAFEMTDFNNDAGSNSKLAKNSEPIETDDDEDLPF